ncbi:hypothetical protein H310_04628 [Aphanomyces invadans]|uniref:Uncharacterized protein n=1 Tax=Aphanomyces invadans TaxID=157072 RepID=A0A024UEM5_9STRA|nr:hypothetical protein H310_04628 [Aphanomyces invadans]ETW04327.1 hypothetical protein H310_04628 [Aphanomyces invadans]|eukprot:XP_008867283.1 hypothetical protein H310_04628 [Aphanomyces invadans]
MTEESTDAGAEAYQAYREKSNATIAAPNGPLLRVIRPPNGQEIDSKRTDLIVTAEELLSHDMDELKEATHVRNVEIQKHFDAINERSRHFEEKLSAEMKARDESIAALRAGFTDAFESAFAAMAVKASDAFHVRLDETILAQEMREDNVQVQFNEFINVTIPSIIEALQGTITRRLDKSHETFDIDNTKLLKREKKMTNQVESHERKTAQAFVDEKERRSTTFVALQEEMHTTMRTDDRQAEKKQSGMIETIVALTSQYDEVRRVREAEDAELLEKVSSAMERLHTSILSSFGEEKEGVGDT